MPNGRSSTGIRSALQGCPAEQPLVKGEVTTSRARDTFESRRVALKNETM